MSGELLRRAACTLAGVWAGAMAGIGFVAAPALFALLTAADAGRVAGRLFAIDAYLGLGVGAVLLLATRRLAAGGPEAASHFSTEVILVLAAVFCIVAGHFALQPMMEAARAGEGRLSFAALHGVAAAFFLTRLGVVAALAWRLGRPTPGFRAAAPPSSGS